MNTYNNETEKKHRTYIIWAIVLVAYVIFGMVFFKCFNVNEAYRTALIRQFGKTVATKEEPGIYFINPLQDAISIYTGERMYDVPITDVTTSDKKNMMADAFVTWKITDVKKYYRQLSSAEAATGRISSNVYSAMKKVISATPQDDVIAGKDGRLSQSILGSITSLDQYGIKIHTFDIKGLDLPEENKTAVFDRMISERQAITAKYNADGDKTYNEAKAITDQEVRQLVSDAEAKAAQIEADGAAQYYEILRKAYSGSPEKEEFYKYWLGLETLKTSLKNGGTIQITEGDPLYNILKNSAK